MAPGTTPPFGHLNFFGRPSVWEKSQRTAKGVTVSALQRCQVLLTDLVPTGGKIGCSFAIEDENRQKNKNFVGIGERLASETECKQSDIKRLEYE